MFLSFNVISVNQPKLTVDVLWLDNNHNFIATGLKMFISRGITDGVNNSRITFFDITDNPPPDTAFARLIISKAEGRGIVSLYRSGYHGTSGFNKFVRKSQL